MLAEGFNKTKNIICTILTEILGERNICVCFVSQNQMNTEKLTTFLKKTH